MAVQGAAREAGTQPSQPSEKEWTAPSESVRDAFLSHPSLRDLVLSLGMHMV